MRILVPWYFQRPEKVFLRIRRHRHQPRTHVWYCAQLVASSLACNCREQVTTVTQVVQATVFDLASLLSSLIYVSRRFERNNLPTTETTTCVSRSTYDQQIDLWRQYSNLSSSFWMNLDPHGTQYEIRDRVPSE